MLVSIIRPLVLPALAAWYDAAEADQLFGRASELARRERPSLPPQPGWGGVLMVRLASLTRCFHEALLESGVTPEQAAERTTAATRAAYRVMSRVPGLLSKLAGPDPTRRVRAATNVFRRFPFGPPSYVMGDVDDGERTVAFDVLRCPVADYFDAAGLNDLCARSFCGLDYELAAEWGATLQRETTLARGDGSCSFRWRS